MATLGMKSLASDPDARDSLAGDYLVFAAVTGTPRVVSPHRHRFLVYIGREYF